MKQETSSTKVSPSDVDSQPLVEQKSKAEPLVFSKKAVVDWIRDSDEIVEPSASTLHFQGDSKQKTFIGGVASMLVTGYLLFMVYSNGKKMVMRDDNKITSLLEQADYEGIGKGYLKDTYKILFEIIENGSQTVELESRDYEKYIKIRLNQIIKTYDKDTKSFNVENKYFPVPKCSKENFERNEFEQTYWEYTQSEGAVRNQYCIDSNKEVYIQGTRDSLILEQDHSYMVTEVWRCISEAEPANNLEASSDCAPDTLVRKIGDETVPSVDKKTVPEADLYLYEEDLTGDSIDNWLRNKVATMKVINSKIDFITFEDIAVRQNEVFVPTVNMYNVYSDNGFRLRYNQFDRQDGWIIPKNLQNPFYDYVFYSSDSFPNPPAGAKRLISEFYFRMAVDQVTHSRNVYFFMDFIGDIGGVTGIMLQIFGWILGGYASYHSAFMTIAALYKVKKTGQNPFVESQKGKEEGVHKLKLSTCTRVFLYFQTTPFKFLCMCCKSEKHALYEDAIEKGSEKIDNDFNLKILIKANRTLKFQMEEMKKEFNIQDKAVFQEQDDRNLIILDDDQGSIQDEGQTQRDGSAIISPVNPSIQIVEDLEGTRGMPINETQNLLGKDDTETQDQSMQVVPSAHKVQIQENRQEQESDEAPAPELQEELVKTSAPDIQEEVESPEFQTGVVENNDKDEAASPEKEAEAPEEEVNEAPQNIEEKKEDGDNVDQEE